MAESAQEALKRLVVGQDRAIKALNRLIDMHFAWLDVADPRHRPPNALIIGPTGTGKTHAIKVAAAALGIPCLVVDSTRLVSTGSPTSLTLEQILQLLVKRARPMSDDTTPVHRATRGIIFLDEFDKLRFGKATEDTAAVQRRLLQFIESDELDLAPSEYEQSRVIDTQGILFIAAGAFTNIERYVGQRPVGHGSGEIIRPGDVHLYGFIEELTARLPIIIRFEPLGVDALRKILEQDDISPLTFYREYFRRNGYLLDIAPDVMLEIARAASESKLGARGLHQELFPVLHDLANQLIRSPTADHRRAELSGFTLTSAIFKHLKNGTYDHARDARTTVADD
ncbi:ATP-dependent Clp protease ATP-binding subunit ClpX [Streptomyces umbrinus]|uniref:AAA family ATPase n=1 Tax=Streptomyces umbrinus TaxID=67370 RepID=UPI00188CC5C5|nr:AAA family ATPase [Streptomyces umbrinus]GHB41717.1 ATP-dependent Clp protease ATP-binding subunit ClpX [Streptomyces umbrinus]